MVPCVRVSWMWLCLWIWLCMLSLLCVMNVLLFNVSIFVLFTLLTTVDVTTQNNRPKLSAAGPAGHKNVSWMLKNIQSGATTCSLCDSSAAKDIMNLSGTGCMKHLEVRHWWVQELVAKKLLRVQWVPRQQSVADVLERSTSRSYFARLRRLLGVSFPGKTSIDSLPEGCFGMLRSFVVRHLETDAKHLCWSVRPWGVVKSSTVER